LQRKIKLTKTMFVQAFKELDEEGYIDKLAKALNLEPKTPCRASIAVADVRYSAKKTPTKRRGVKTRERAVAERCTRAKLSTSR